MKKSLGLAVSAALVLAFAGTANVAHADTAGPITFESPLYSTGSVNGQSGWLSGKSDDGRPFDQAVTVQSLYPDFGPQSLRISNAVTSGAFGNQTFSPAVAPAGESTPQTHFDSTFQIGTAVATAQPGLFMSVSPDDGTGGRMSWLGFEDKSDGIHVEFSDAADTGPVYKEADFKYTEVARFAYGTAHTIRFSIDFLTGPANDVVKIYIDGALKITGTTWEDYYRYDNEQKPPITTPVGVEPPAISKLEFREGGAAAPGTAGKGFLIDNVSLASSTPAPPAPTVTAPGAPTNATSTSGDGSAAVSWTAPASNGGSAVTGYTVTSAPGGMTATTTGGLSATVNGLTNGTAYTFTVTATNSTGTSAASSASAAVTPTAPVVVPASPVFVSGPTAAVTRISDYNKDGRTDLVARDSAGVLWLYPGNGTGGFLTRRQIGTGWKYMTAIITPGDVTGDGKADVIARDSLGRLWAYIGNGANGFSSRKQIGRGWQNYTITSAANLNGSGRPDLLARDSVGGLWLYPVSGNAVIGTRTKVGQGWNGYTILSPGDFSGDGRADILARDAAGSLWLYRGNGAGRVIARTAVATGLKAMTALVSLGNWNRAVGNDLLTRDAAGRLWFYPGDNAGHLGAPTRFGTGMLGMTFIG